LICTEKLEGTFKSRLMRPDSFWDFGAL